MSERKKTTKKLGKNLLFIFLIFVTVSALFALFFQPFEAVDKVALSTLINKINQGEIKKITVSGNELLILEENGEEVESRKETESSLSESLINLGADKINLS
jgi:hypothetical protein